MSGRPMPAAKVKISITLSGDLVDRIDREAAAHPRLTRSAVIETWLRRAGRAHAWAALREETVRYYDSAAAEDSAEDEAIARASDGLGAVVTPPDGTVLSHGGLLYVGPEELAFGSGPLRSFPPETTHVRFVRYDAMTWE